MGCPIERAHGGDHFWFSDRLVNSAISWSNRADRPSKVGKFILLPFQILSFAPGVFVKVTSDQGVARPPKWPEGQPEGGSRPPEAFF